MVEVDIYFDGACKNVKGSRSEPFGYGVAVFIDNEYSKVFSSYGGGKEGTSNISEWEGCVAAMNTALEMTQLLNESLEINIFSDSQIITRQFNGEYQIIEPSFKQYFERAKKISEDFNINLRLCWIRRELNQEADRLSKLGLEEIRNGLSKNIQPNS